MIGRKAAPEDRSVTESPDLEMGGIDCDIHPAVPAMDALLPYLSGHWRDSVVQRGVHELNSIAYPLHAPLSARPDWRSGNRRPASDLESVRCQALAPFGTRIAICNCLYGVHLLFSEDMAAAFARAVNDWIAREWLDREPRLRASIVVPLQNSDMAVDEIERRAADRRFVQVLLPVMGEMPLGKRAYWPIYAAAERHDLPICIHAGSAYHHPVTSVGWPSYYTEDYAAQSVAFQAQLTSLVCEGVFSKFPKLRVVLAESGITWLPAYLWRLTKYWRGLRSEIPWTVASPNEIVRGNVRFTLQPVDAPTGDIFARILDHLGCDELMLFSTDYPHWQFDGDRVLPEALSGDLVQKIMLENPQRTYPRLEEAVQ
jgi:predicted TIM-barrel fold metal-dependent hydrolase